MQLLLDVKDNKADFVIELLKNLSFVKTKELTPAKSQILKELKDAVNEVNLAKQGKIKLQTAKEFLDEIQD